MTAAEEIEASTLEHTNGKQGSILCDNHCAVAQLPKVVMPRPAPETRQLFPLRLVDRYVLISCRRDSSKFRQLSACLCLATAPAPADHGCAIPSTQTGGHCTTLTNLCASLPPGPTSRMHARIEALSPLDLSRTD